MTMTMELNNLMSGALFSVIFFDGEREIDLGTILITPSMNFKSFQSLISQKIGISPHQITTYFTPFQHHRNNQRRRPVTSKFDFAAALPDTASWFFWVVLKRSRRVRRRRPKNDPPEMDNFVLLRRNPNLDYLAEKERYLMSMNLNSNVYSDLSSTLCYGGNGGYAYGIGGSDDGDGGSSSSDHNRVVYCDVCWNAQILGHTVPFHWCKNDAVTKVFRSPAGPIAPPVKSRLG